MAASKSASYDYLIKLLLIGDSGTRASRASSAGAARACERLSKPNVLRGMDEAAMLDAPPPPAARRRWQELSAPALLGRLVHADVHHHHWVRWRWRASHGLRQS